MPKKRSKKINPYEGPIKPEIEGLALAVITYAIQERKWTWLLDDGEHPGSARFWIELTGVPDVENFQQLLYKRLDLPHTMDYYTKTNQQERYARATANKRRKQNV